MNKLTNLKQRYIDEIETKKEKVLISKGSSLKLYLVAEGIAGISQISTDYGMGYCGSRCYCFRSREKSA